MKKIFDYLVKNKDYVVFSFFVVSIFSWFGEMGYAYFIKHKTILPGVLYGPWCPIYGSAFILLLLCVKQRDSKFTKFIKILLIVTIIEYLSSYVCEFVFRRRVWNYTKYPLDFDGRICLHMSLLFTITAYVFIHYVEPALKKFFLKLGNKIKYINFGFTIIFLLDLIVTILGKI